MGEPLRVLFVENSEDNVLSVLKHLQQEGFDVTCKRVDTDKAMTAALREQSWDAVLSAYYLPEIDAYGALSILHESNIDIPFIIISDSNTEDAAVVALKAGADDYLVGDNLNRLGFSIRQELRDAEMRRQQQRSERELRDSERRYHYTLDNMLEGCQVIDFDWRYLYVNDAAARHGKQTEKALLGHTMMEMYPGIEDTAVFAELKRCMESRTSCHIENEFTFPDGNKGRFELSIIPVPEGISVLSIDITERKRSGEIVDRLNTVLRTIRNVNQLIVKEKDVDHLLHGICHVLTDTGAYRRVWIALLDRDRRLIHAAQDGLDLSFSALLRMLERGELPSCGRKALARGDVALMINIAAACGDCPLHSTDEEGTGMAVSLEYEGHVYGLLAVSVPATLAVESEEQKLLKEFADDVAFALRNLEIEEEHKRAEEVFNVASEASPIGVYIAQDGRFIYVNPRFQNYTGYRKGELLESDSLSYVFPEDRELVRANAVAMLKGERLFPYEYRFVTKSGEIKWVMETVTSIDYGGEKAALGNFMDVTEYKLLERKMLEYGELNRLKSDLLSLVSHELRTPLATIKGYSTMLLDYGEKLDDAEKVEYLCSVDRAADRLTDLVDHLLDMSRLEAGLLKLRKVPTDVVKLVSQAVAEARIIAPRHNIARVSRRLPKVMVDPRRIRQVLDNLINNACKYSDEETDVTVSVQCDEEDLLISVADGGRGIPAAELDRVFNRMYRIEQRLAPDIKGFGLGLAICKGLVEAHGGRIWVKSRVDKGSTFFFSIPLVKRDEKNDKKKEQDKICSRHRRRG
ncbi:ATP-binding protein [Chloroflexota bacterium]